MWNNSKDKISGITAEDLKEVFEYDSNDGYLRWKVARQKVIKGSIAGYVSKSDGYHYVGFRHKEYCAHRLIWVIITGEWPQHQVDHINGIRSDNRWVNLRQSTQSQANINQILSKRNKIGVRGVHVRNGKYRVRIQIDGKEIVIGWFSTLDEAAKARKEAEVKYFGEFSPDRNRTSVRYLRVRGPKKEKMPILKEMDPRDYFAKFIKIDESTGCWNWTGKFNSSGYGLFSNNGVNGGIATAASRAAWLLFKNSELGRFDFVCHTCDNRRCCNPDHLFVGSPQDNSDDCLNKERINRGEDRPQSKLTEITVREARQLRQQGWSWRKLAARYGVHVNAIRSATMGETWSHVDEPIPTYIGKPGNPSKESGNPSKRIEKYRGRIEKYRG